MDDRENSCFCKHGQRTRLKQRLIVFVQNLIHWKNDEDDENVDFMKICLSMSVAMENW